MRHDFTLDEGRVNRKLALLVSVMCMKSNIRFLFLKLRQRYGRHIYESIKTSKY